MTHDPLTHCLLCSAVPAAGPGHTVQAADVANALTVLYFTQAPLFHSGPDSLSDEYPTQASKCLSWQSERRGLAHDPGLPPYRLLAE